jgi:deoxycytidine triphosphate deaminase
MSMIPLEDWQKTGIKVTSQSKRVADPVDDALKNSTERVALDLRVGDNYQVEFHEWIKTPDVLVLRPNDCFRIRVDENIEAPNSVFGEVCSKGARSAEGLLVANQKVDPCFSGLLELAVYNAGRRSVTIKKGQVFAGVWFSRLDPVPQDTPQRHPSETDGTIKRGWRERWHGARPYVITGTLSALAAVVAGVILRLV